ncbi:TPA: hypothetical protein N0F65_012416 [Lagenidium giganteum]|uniref:Tubulin-specific chaperone D n=1 Tax=Lagenidium giganteum TaxID=4803 RepID=A0AAV2YKP2_9STRA|nr:TPA: hypothetical protein N0F65_012416 [Lagenidium giganteum]
MAEDGDAAERGMDAPDEHEDGSRCEKEHFEENEEVAQLVERMVDASRRDAPATEAAQLAVSFDRFNALLDRYLEQSQLLDPFLRGLVAPIMSEIQRVITAMADDRRASASATATDAFPFQVYQNANLHRLFQLIYQLCRVRGFKTVLKLFPHEVADVEPTVLPLQSQDRDDHSTWETRYVLLLWISMLCLVPFDLQTIDSSIATTGAASSSNTSNSNISIVTNLVALCKIYLSDPGATQMAAALCLSRLLSRPDMEASYQQRFLDWADAQLQQAYDSNGPRTNQFQITGIMMCLAHLARHAPRERHVTASKGYFPSIMRLIAAMADEDARNDHPSSSTLHRKLSVKLVQRLGLLYLPPRVMKWRYQRGLRSLDLNFHSLGLQGGGGPQATAAQAKTAVEDDGDVDQDMGVPDSEVEHLEQIVEVLLCGLRDKDTVVRWSAAKGIGRITGRLPFEFADDVVQSVLELFVSTEGDGAWHGATLALAELARRGVLLPSRLQEAVTCVARALQYDVRRGSNSIGSHIRDAACYACWSFARAYEPLLLLPHLRETLAPAMLINCVFDRELNCRRAASAAFQENVGRQGNAKFPHGIELLTRADYFSVANLRHAYLDVSVFIAKLAEYRYAMLDHLVQRKISHWDANIRALAAAAIGKIGALDPTYAMRDVIPRLLAMSQSVDSEVITRHGATLAVAHVLTAISNVPAFVDGEVQRDLKALPMEIEKRRLFRGRGGELVRVAVCNVMEATATVNLSLSFAHIKKYLAIIEECLVHPVVPVRDAGVDAFRAVSLQYIPRILAKGTPAHIQTCTEMTQRFLQGIVVATPPGTLNANVAVRKGFTRGLGVVPLELIQGRFAECLGVLRRAALMKEQTTEEQDAESRVAAIRALVDLCSRAEFEALLHGKEDSVVQTLVACIETDYGVDERGDVGSWIRREAMIGLEQLLLEQNSSSGLGTKRLCGRRVRTVYGEGKIVRVVGGRADDLIDFNEDPVCYVEFEKPFLGYYYFAGTHTGLIKQSRLQLAVPSSAQAASTDFYLPKIDERDAKRQRPSESLASRKVPFARCLSPESVSMLFRALAKQLAEKLDGVRAVAGKVLFSVLHSADPRVDAIPDRATLETSILPATACINWSMAHQTFPIALQLADSPSYMDAVVSGLVVSVGGISESVVKASRSALLDWIRRHIEAKNIGLLRNFANVLVELFHRHSQDDRVIIPLMKTWAILLESSVMSFLFTEGNSGDGQRESGADFGERLYQGLRGELLKTTSIPRLIAGISVLTGLLPSCKETETKALRALIMFMGHKFPRVRKATAEKVYTRLLLHEEVVPDDKYDEIVAVLSETPWDVAMATARTARNQLLQALDMDTPEKKQPAPSTATVDKPKTEEESYQTLVKEMGY